MPFRSADKIQKLQDSNTEYHNQTQHVDWGTVVATRWRWENSQGVFQNIQHSNHIALDDLLEIDHQKQSLLKNTELYCEGLPANNALLWGARGTGKSSLIHALFTHFATQGLRLIEVDKQHFAYIHSLIAHLFDLPYKFLIVCDDLSFSENDSSFMEIKAL